MVLFIEEAELNSEKSASELVASLARSRLDVTQSQPITGCGSAPLKQVKIKCCLQCHRNGNDGCKRATCGHFYPSRSRSLSWCECECSTFTLVIFFLSVLLLYIGCRLRGKKRKQDCRQKPSSGTSKAFRQLESQFLL